MRFARPVFFRLFAAFLCSLFIIAWPALTSATALQLTDTSQPYALLPHSYITEDPDFRLNWRDIYSQHINNVRGIRPQTSSITPGFTNHPYYVIFSLENQTLEDKWVLDFGDMQSGRSAFVTSLFLYNVTDREMIVDGYRRDNAPKDLGRGLNKHKIAMTIPSGESKTYILYLLPNNQNPFSFSINLTSQSHALSEKESGPLPSFNSLIILGLIATAGFCMGLLLMNPRFEHLTMALYFLSQYVLFTLQSNYFFVARDFPIHSSGWAYLLAALFLLLTAKGFLKINWSQGQRFSFFFILMFCAVALSSKAFLSFVIPLGAALHPVILHSVTFLASAMALLFVFTKGLRAASGTGLLAIGLISYISGLCLTLFSASGIIPAQPVFLNAYWYSLLPQAFCFVLALVLKFRAAQQHIIYKRLKENQEEESLARLRQSKEAADQQKLLRVLEREREVMEELREREAQRTEEMRKAKIAADEANRAKSAFLAVISHEIRTPMTGIMGMIKLLQDTNLDDKQQEFAATIQESGTTMLALLNDILDFEKIETGKMEIEEVAFDLHRLLSSVITLMSGRAQEQGIELNLDLDPNVPKFLNGDPTRLRQILLNLIGNGIKFTSDGSVTVHVHHKGEGRSPSHHILYFGVQDTGIGISEEGQAKLFSPFAQADKSVARKFGGSGLGLVICKNLIEAMGSEIRLDSEEGKGSTFSFTLELESDEKSVITDGDHTELRLNIPSLRILIAEDNEINRKVLQGFLEPQKHIIDFVDDGEKAVQKAKNGPYDMILMDIEMPLLKGHEAAQRIRENDGPNKASPIMALTGNVSPEDIKIYQAHGMSGHLAKPIQPEALYKALAGAVKTPDNIGAESDPKAPKDHKDQKKMPSPALPVTQNKADNSANAVPLDPAFFDESMISGLKDSLGAEATLELLQGLYDKTEEIIESLKATLKDENYEDLYARGHELKGMAGNFGFKRISAMAKDIEQIARKNKLDGIAVKLDQLPEIYNQSKEKMQNWLKS